MIKPHIRLHVDSTGWWCVEVEPTPTRAFTYVSSWFTDCAFALSRAARCIEMDKARVIPTAYLEKLRDG